MYKITKTNRCAAVIHANYTNNNNNNNNCIQRRHSRFFTISSQRRELSPTCTLKWPGRNSVQITCNTSSTYHVQVSYNVPLGTKGQLSYSVWQSWNRIYMSFILLAEPLNRWRRGGNRSTRRKPLVTSFRKCHILQPEDSSPKRDSNSRSSIGGRLGKQIWSKHSKLTQYISLFWSVTHQQW